MRISLFVPQLFVARTHHVFAPTWSVPLLGFARHESHLTQLVVPDLSGSAACAAGAVARSELATSKEPAAIAVTFFRNMFPPRRLELLICVGCNQPRKQVWWNQRRDCDDLITMTVTLVSIFVNPSSSLDAVACASGWRGYCWNEALNLHRPRWRGKGAGRECSRRTAFSQDFHWDALQGFTGLSRRLVRRCRRWSRKMESQPRVRNGGPRTTSGPWLGLLRRYLPKGSELSRYESEDHELVANYLNRRPRKTLDWMTPAERMRERITPPKPPGVASTATIRPAGRRRAVKNGEAQASASSVCTVWASERATSCALW